MTPNDILRRLRYTFDLNDSKMLDIFQLSGRATDRATVSAWMKQDDQPDYIAMPDVELAAFLNGLIVKRRGAREGGPPPVEERINHNTVLVKLKIAMSYKAEDMLAVLEKADMQLGKSELSAFFRKPSHKHYRECKDQVLRRFLMGLQLTLRGDDKDPVEEAAETEKARKNKPDLLA